MKSINFRKIGTVLAIAVFGFISFTAGVDLTQNANSTASSSALPISKGGTGGKTAPIAAANILGTNFENYSGILPVANGGLGADISTVDGKLQAQSNLNVINSYSYYDEVETRSNNYFRIASVVLRDSSGNTGNADHQTVLAEGLTNHQFLPFAFLISVTGRGYVNGNWKPIITSLNNLCIGNATSNKLTFYSYQHIVTSNNYEYLDIYVLVPTTNGLSDIKVSLLGDGNALRQAKANRCIFYPNRIAALPTHAANTDIVP
jgi:hypothetical protein